MARAIGNVLVGGGTGFIGGHLCKALTGKGYTVTQISRMPGPQRISWNDLKQTGLPEGTTAVVNLAGQNVLDMTQRWTAGFKQNVYNSRVNTTHALAQAIMTARRKPSVYVTISGVGIYRPDAKREYSEDFPVVCFDFFSNLCKNWEQAAKMSTDTVRLVTVRSGVVLGRTGGMIKQLYLPFFLGLGGPIAPGDQFLPWIHVDDLTDVIVFAIENPEVEGVINGVAPQVITNREFTEAFAGALKRPAFIPVPEFALNILLGKERASMLTRGQKVICSKLKKLGFEHKYPDIKSACKEVIS